MNLYKKDFSDELIEIYQMGLFPMADNVDDDEIYIISPENRGILSIEELHIPRSLLKKVKKYPYKVTINKDFEQVIKSCAEIREDRKESWINDIIIRSFISLHKKGHAHSIEVWDKDNNLIGGLYGLAIGAVFCGESMFSRASDASKIALIHLCARLWKAEFNLLDCQFTNDHLVQFGCFEISASEYKNKLEKLKNKEVDFLLSGIADNEQDLLLEYLANRAK